MNKTLRSSPYIHPAEEDTLTFANLLVIEEHRKELLHVLLEVLKVRGTLALKELGFDHA